MDTPTSEDHVVRAAVILRRREQDRLSAPTGTKGVAAKNKHMAERALYEKVDLLEQKNGVKP